MKNWIILVVLFLVGPMAMAGNFEVEVEPFNHVRILGNYRVVLQKGDSVKVEVNNNDEDVDDDKIICEVDDDQELTIRIKADTYKEREIEIIITYTDLEVIQGKFGCRIEMKNPIEQDEIRIAMESGSKIRATVDLKKLNAEISAGGSIHVDGKVLNAAYKVSAGGTIGAASLIATSVAATVRAGGEVICYAEEDLAIKITSGGNVSYLGEPEGFEQNITLGGKITKLKNPKE